MWAGDKTQMLVSLLFACASSTPQPPGTAPGSAAASLDARPAWSQEHGYAPGLSAAQLASFNVVEHSGPLEGALLRCAVETSHRGDRARWLASRRGIDTSLPDIDGWIYTDELGVRTHSPSNSASALLGAPSMRLAPGDEVQIVLRDRGFIRQVTFDTLHGAFDGTLPLVLSGAKSAATCHVVPPAEVDAALRAALSDADAALSRLDAQRVDLDAADFGYTVTPDPREEIYPAAALVGWAHDDVGARVAQVAQAEAAFRVSLADAVRAEVSGLPRAVRVDGSELAARRATCPRPLGYWRYRLDAECAIELVVSAGADGLPPLEVVFSDGERGPAYLWSVPEGAHALTEAVLGGVEPGEAGMVLIRYLHGQEPIAVRIRGAEGVRWLPLTDAAARGAVRVAGAP